MTRYFKAAILRELNSPLSIEDVRAPALKKGQLLLELIAIGVCGSQLSERKGLKGNSGFLPHFLGHEGFGRVADTHSSIRKVAKGDLVVIHWKKGAGLASGLVEMNNATGETIKGGPSTTFSEFAVVGEDRVTVVPSDTDPILGTLLGCGLSTGLGVVDNELDFKMGQSALVIGAGGVGLSVILALHLKGAGEICVLDRDVSKSDKVLEIGASAFFPDIESLTRDLSNRPRGFDVVVEVTGNASLRSSASGFLNPGGTLVIIGQGEVSSPVTLGTERAMFGSVGVRVVFSQGGAFSPDSDLPRWLNLLNRRPQLVQAIAAAHHGPIMDLNALLDSLESGSVGRPILVLTQEKKSSASAALSST